MKLWEADTGKLLLTRFSFGETDWFATAPDGRFDGSEGGMKQVYLVQGMKTISLDSGSDKFTPDLMAQVVLTKVANVPKEDLSFLHDDMRIDLGEEGTANVDEDVLKGLPARLADMPIVRTQVAVFKPTDIKDTIDAMRDTSNKHDYNKGNRMFDQHRYETATRYYQRVIRYKPFAQAHFNLGLALRILGDQEKADAAFAQACEMKEPKGCEMAR